jgi:hypothetical protein
MAIINNNKLAIDLPVWEPLRAAQGGNSSAISTSCAALNPVMHINFGRYIYYINAATSFWKYDTWTDTYIQLASPPIPPTTFSTMRFLMSAGIEGFVLGATNNTLYVPANFGKAYVGYDVSIVSGTGAGQRRTILDVSDAIVEDIAIATTVTNTLGDITLTDTAKNWGVNRWLGYQARVIQGAGSTQVRRIIGNSANQLIFGSTLYAAYEPFAIPSVFSPAIAATAGVQTIVSIEANNVTLNFPWSIVPDSSSRFKIEGGAIVLASSQATSNYSVQQYDAISDTWYVRTSLTNFIRSAGTDASLERTGDQATVWERGIVTQTSTTSSLIDSSKSWNVNQWASSSLSGSYYVRIWSGQGEGQQARILTNTATSLTYETMSVAPNSGSQYFIDGFDAGRATSGSFNQLIDSTKNWPLNRWKNYALRIVSGSGFGTLLPIASSNSSSITVYGSSSFSYNSSSVYNITADPDKTYFAIGGQSSIAFLNLTDDLLSYGRDEESGIALNASAQFGNNKPIGISFMTASGTTATITTAVSHSFKLNQPITIRGISHANYNGTFSITSIPSASVFQYTMAGTPNASGSSSQSLSTLVDTTKNWRTNQWAGYNLYMNVSTIATNGIATGASARIVSNTSSSLVFAAPQPLVPLNGVTRYILTKTDMIGSMYTGFATGSVPTATTLTDTNAFFVGSGSISGNLLTVTTNVGVSGSLGIGSLITGSLIFPGTFIVNYASGTLVTDYSGSYLVNYTQSVPLTAITSSGWVTNFFAGRRLKILAGSGIGEETTIASNTNTTLTFGTITAPGLLSSSYAIMQQPTRSVGIEAQWVQNTTNLDLRGRRIYIPRGGATNNWEFIDVSTDKVEFIAASPLGETLSTGTMTAYDGGDRIYFTKDATLRFYYLDTNTNQIHGAGLAPFANGAAIIRNRMEIFTSPDGLKYLWFVKHTSTEVMRTMLYY